MLGEDGIMATESGKWFAWRPVYCLDVSRTVWLVWVERYRAISFMDYAGPWRYSRGRKGMRGLQAADEAHGSKARSIAPLIEEENYHE